MVCEVARGSLACVVDCVSPATCDVTDVRCAHGCLQSSRSDRARETSVSVDPLPERQKPTLKPEPVAAGLATHVGEGALGAGTGTGDGMNRCCGWMTASEAVRCGLVLFLCFSVRVFLCFCVSVERVVLCGVRVRNLLCRLVVVLVCLR